MIWPQKRYLDRKILAKSSSFRQKLTVAEQLNYIIIIIIIIPCFLPIRFFIKAIGFSNTEHLNIKCWHGAPPPPHNTGKLVSHVSKCKTTNINNQKDTQTSEMIGCKSSNTVAIHRISINILSVLLSLSLSLLHTLPMLRNNRCTLIRPWCLRLATFGVVSLSGLRPIGTIHDLRFP